MLNRRTPFHNETDAPSEVKSFKDQQKKEAAFDARDRGVRTVPLSRIVGSVGRYQDFDSRFRFKHNMSSERLQWITEAMRQGRPLGPVELYQIKDDYYVLDGNHRISAAKQLNHDEILAHVFSSLFPRRIPFKTSFTASGRSLATALGFRVKLT